VWAELARLESNSKVCASVSGPPRQRKLLQEKELLIFAKSFKMTAKAAFMPKWQGSVA
jgi:hypothetical protein